MAKSENNKLEKSGQQKQCKSCIQWIHASATVCQHCRQAQGFWRRHFGDTAIVISIVMVMIAIAQLFGAFKQNIDASKALETAQNDVNEMRYEYSQILKNFKKDQEKYATITLLNTLIIQATNGDKNAAIILADMSKNLNSEYSQIAKDAVRGAYEKYFGSKISYNYFKPVIPDHEVIERLDEENFLERKRAIGTIRRRKMYKQIPNLISRLKTETHLDVIGEIERTLNALLGTKIKSLNLEEITDSYMNIWESKKSTLLNSNLNHQEETVK